MVLTPADAVASIVVHRHDDTFVPTPTAYFHGTESGWYEGTHSTRVRHHPDPAAAAADFIHRLAAWLDGRHILGEDPEPSTD